ncbi:SDR family NAD(P)-dependent oxidoreductase [Alphaproteobacteria bacterium]|nr:SDR family NAD(P)-dependent oxidoreductase [Alphaproteobacteria bacterium]
MKKGEYKRIIIVTGAASGVGASVARRLAGPGTAFVLCTRRNEGGGVTAVGTDARAAGADVVIDFRGLAEEGAGEGLVGATVASFGRIDQIISNAGFADKRRAGDFDLTGLSGV